MPLPGSRVIPARWSEHHQAVSAGSMTSRCRITRADGEGSTDANGQWTSGPRSVIYDGPARVVREAVEDNHPVQGERRLTTRRYSVQILISSAEPKTGDSVLVYESIDPVMVNKNLRIEGIVFGSEMWSRDFTAIEFEEGV